MPQRSKASAFERANSQPFLIGLCDVLEVPHPDPRQHDGYLKLTLGRARKQGEEFIR